MVNSLYNSASQGVNDRDSQKDWIAGLRYRSNTDVMPKSGDWNLRSTFGGGRTKSQGYPTYSGNENLFLNDTQLDYRLGESSTLKLENLYGSRVRDACGPAP